MCTGLPQETIFAELVAVLQAARASCPVVLGIERPLPGVCLASHILSGLL